MLLGYFGVCPNVDIGVLRLDQPTVLTFLLSGGKGEGSFVASFDIIDETTNQTIASSEPLQAISNPKGATTLLSTLLIVFGHAGRFSVRLLANGNEVFRSNFGVSMGLPQAT